MQMPGGQIQRGASMNVYTGLLFLAVLALLAACVWVYMQVREISPDGTPFKIQDGSSGIQFSGT